MSWSASAKVQRANMRTQIDAMQPPQVFGTAEEQSASLAQFEAAKEAAKAIASVTPGPELQITLSGHANGVGYRSKEGWSNDMITVSIYQFIAPPVVETPSMPDAEVAIPEAPKEE